MLYFFTLAAAVDQLVFVGTNLPVVITTYVTFFLPHGTILHVCIICTIQDPDNRSQEMIKTNYNLIRTILMNYV